jgi:hypothetical protein
VGWTGGVEQLEKFDEFTAATTVPDEGVNPTGEQINTPARRRRCLANEQLMRIFKSFK